MRWLFEELLGHPFRVARYAVCIARELGWRWPALARLFLAGLLHDIGKVRVLRLCRQPRRLAPDEQRALRQHTLAGHALLRFGPRLVAQVALFHHERWDGSGYPYALRGHAIPAAARIIAVADVFDALTSERPYKHAWPTVRAVQLIGQAGGREFDPQVVAAFFSALVPGMLGRLEPALA